MKWSSREERKRGKRNKVAGALFIDALNTNGHPTIDTHNKSQSATGGFPTFYGSNNKKLSPSQRVVPVVNKDN